MSSMIDNTALHSERNSITFSHCIDKLIAKYDKKHEIDRIFTFSLSVFSVFFPELPSSLYAPSKVENAHSCNG